MRRVRSAAWAALMIGCGYLCGLGQISQSVVTAQQDNRPDAATLKINEAYKKLVDAKDALEAAGKYETITDGLNVFLIMSGGGNAKTDLEAGQGVDPETFAALYAGKAIPELQPLMGVNEQGQVTYNNEVVRMYSKSRLQRVFAERLKYINLGI